VQLLERLRDGKVDPAKAAARAWINSDSYEKLTTEDAP
jgi:hypothetical protein